MQLNLVRHQFTEQSPPRLKRHPGHGDPLLLKKEKNEKRPEPEKKPFHQHLVAVVDDNTMRLKLGHLLGLEGDQMTKDGRPQLRGTKGHGKNNPDHPPGR